MFVEYVVADTDKYWPNMFARLASYPLGLALTLAVLALMPSEDNFIRKAGERLAGPYTLMMVPYLFLRAYSPLVDDYDSGHSIPLFILQVTLHVVTSTLHGPRDQGCAMLFSV